MSSRRYDKLLVVRNTGARQNQRKAAQMRKIEKLLLESNDALRSAHSIAERDGVNTNWRTFKNMVSKALDDQHELTNRLRRAAGFNYI